MTLGEKITKLRTSRNMSQGDLAEQMNVSRQSVSKWETNTSVPDLDKLIAMSDIFNVTIDEMVKGEDKKAPSDKSSGENTVQTLGRTQMITGCILLTAGLVGALISLAVSIVLIVPSLYLALCGILCLTVKKHIGLVIGWITFLPCYFGLPYLTGSSMGAVLNIDFYMAGKIISLCISLIMWAFMVTLIFFTMRKTKYKKYTLLAIGWAAFLSVKGYITVLFMAFRGEEIGVKYLIAPVSVLVLLVILLIFTVKALIKLIRELKEKPIAESSKRKLKIIIVIAVTAGILFGAAEIVCLAKFGAKNPIRTAIGLYRVVVLDEPFALIQDYPEVFIARPGSSLKDWMENQGYHELYTDQTGSLHKFTNGRDYKYIHFSGNRFYSVGEESVLRKAD